MKSARHYLDQANSMRDLAKNTQIEAFQASCLRAAKRYESLARNAEQRHGVKQDEDE
ncbi:MAG TPA: hypothetical protein VGI89_00850 [Rhizomicrobium sp.]|jgi:hypothetical protein